MGDVDELHAAVGHGHEALPQDAATEHQVVLAQLVADRAGLARQQREGPRRGSRVMMPPGIQAHVWCRPRVEHERRRDDDREERARSR